MSSNSFLHGGGEMGEITRTFDWSKTALGPSEQWSQSLRTLVNMMLTSRFPMLIFWGPELITFYNDAFRPSLGNDGKHPSSLGQRGEESWAESWPVIGPMIYQIMAGGEAVWFEDQKLPIYRDGIMGHAYWTYSFSPLTDDTSTVNGILVTCSETTKAVEGLQQLEASETFARMLIANSPVANLVLLGSEMTIESVNEGMLFLLGRDTTIVGQPFMTIMPELQHTPLLDRLRHVMLTEETFHQLEERFELVRYGQLHTGYYNYIYTPLKDASGQSIGVIVTAIEVTAQVVARQQLEQTQQVLRQSEARQTFLLTLSDRLRSLTTSSDIQYQAASVLGEYLGVNRVGYAEDQGDGKTIVVTRNYVNGVSNLEGRYHYSDYGPTLLADFLSGQTVVRSDIAHDPTLTDEEKEAHRVLQLGATINKPLLKEGRLLAVMFIHSQQAYHWTDEDLALLDETAERTWAAVVRARTEEALQHTKERLQKAISTDTVGVLFFCLNGRIQDINGAFARISGYSRAELIDATTSTPLPDDSLWQAITYSADELADSGETNPYERRVTRPDGSVWWGLFAPTRISGTGFNAECVEFVINITPRKQAEEALRQSEEQLRMLSKELESRVQQRTQELLLANQDLTRSNDNLQQFAYVASHDLQEPLRKIQSFSSLLSQQLNDQSTEINNDYIQRIISASVRMSTLIKDLLTYSRISTRQQTFEPVSLDAIVAGVINTLDWEIAQQNAQIHVDKLPVLRGDESQLSQLFQNLLTNALKFTPAGEQPQVAITCSRIDVSDLPAVIKPTSDVSSFYQISVSDKGIGFDTKYLDRIFQVFQRLHGKNEFPGTGVGLAICQRVAENHGGGITAVSKPGKGAAFFVYLPV